MALTRLGTDQISDAAITNAKIHGSAAIAGSKLADDLTYGSNLTVSGNLTVNGTTTTVDTVNVNVKDPLMILSSGATGAASVDAGFIVERGTDEKSGAQVHYYGWQLLPPCQCGVVPQTGVTVYRLYGHPRCRSVRLLKATLVLR